MLGFKHFLLLNVLLSALTTATEVIPVYTKFSQLIPELKRVLPNVTFHQVNDPDNDEFFKESPIVICDFDKLAPQLDNLPKAKWVQGTWAGVNHLLPYYNKSNPVNFNVTRYSGDNFGKIMGEYVIGNIIAFERNFSQIRENQKQKIWSQSGKIGNFRPIYDLTIGIVGFGTIGSRIGKTLNLLGAKVVALGRKPELPAEYSFVHKYYTKNNLPDMLKECDYVINLLPSTPETDNFYGNDVLENCKDKETVFMNIGRGNVISEEALVKALHKNWISGAILDVFAAEPLPPSSPLWDINNVVITPHVANEVREKELAEHFKNNYELYHNNLPLPFTVNFTKGY